jgi:glycosyltransferase involved in cell wall biosynthesis
VLAVTTDLNTDQRVHRVALALHQAGFQVSVIGRQLPTSKPLPEMPYRRLRLRLPFHKGKWFYICYNYFLFWKLLFFPADIFIANDLDTLGAVWSASRFRRKKVVYDAHELFTQVPELVRRPKTQAIWKRMEAHILPRLKFFYTVNESLSRIYHEMGAVKPEVVRNLPLRQHGVEHRDKPGNILLYQGALNEGRGIERMIAAMEHLPEQVLWIIGGGPLAEKLRAIAADSPAKDRIVFYGWVRIDQVASYTRQASLGFSLEEDRGLNYRYALPNKLLDCVQCGVPVLVSQLPEMEEVVRTYGVGETLTDSADLAEAVRMLLSDTERWRRYHEACLKAAEELCWERESEKLVALMRRVQVS